MNSDTPAPIHICSPILRWIPQQAGTF